MGWTGVSYRGIDTPKARRTFMDNEINGDGWTVLKSAMKGSTYYAAVRNPSGYVFGMVALTSISDNGTYFNYKDMSEDMLPYFYDCPETILKLLSPTEDERSLEWRSRCRERARRMATWNKVKTTPNIHIQVTAQNLGAIQDGTELILYRYKRSGYPPCWCNGRYIFREKVVRHLTKEYTDYQIVTEDGQEYCDLNYYKRKEAANGRKNA